ncbi:MAG: hypothetical protein DMG55_21815 [Acidobacteria bacterium]|nr:MAG: hypothetical protein DMG55_21815 [Acidobacteriota bacterium]
MGGGVPSFVFLTSLCLILSIYAFRLLWVAKDRFSFAIATLFIASLLFGFMGEEIDSGPVAISFWCSAAILPRLYERFVKSAPHLNRARDVVPVSAGALRPIVRPS